MIALLLTSVSCATYREELNSSQRHYEANEYEQALYLLRDLESNLLALGPAERARYAYLRGMTDYRMGYRVDARHWLALAREMEQEKRGSLSDTWNTRLTEALRDLDREVYSSVRGAESPSVSPEGGLSNSSDGKR